jgi:capsular polysaccharide biosynthesis protein
LNDTRNPGPRLPPDGYVLLMPPQPEADSITLAEIFSIAFGSWKFICLFAFLVAAMVGASSYLLKPQYRATTIISPVREGGIGASGALGSQLGGLAALAGINLGSGGRDKDRAMATLKSSGFAREFIISENLLPVMYPEKWDATTAQWKAGVEPPSLELAVTRFTGGIRTINEEQRTGIVTLTVAWTSPDIAARWANQMVTRLNERMRLEALASAERSIKFLNQELAKTSVVGLQHAIHSLIQEQVNNAMLANVQREYAFRVIDAAVSPEQRSSPKRTIMAMIGGVLGGFLALFIVFIRRSIRLGRERELGGTGTRSA